MKYSVVIATCNRAGDLGETPESLAFFSGMTNSEIATELGQSCEVVDDGLRSGMSPFFCRLKSLRFSPEEPIRRDRPTVIRPGARSNSRYAW